MASRALQIAPRSRRRNPNPGSIHRFFSSSSTSDDADNNTPSPPSSSSSSSSSSSLSSYFNDVKASLKQPPQPPRKSSSFSPSSPSTPLSSNIASLEDIRKNLSEFRSRSFVPNPPPPQQSSSSSPISLEELYKRNVIPKPQDSPKAKLSFEAIRESLRQMGSSSSTEGGQTKGKTDPMSLSDFKQSLRLRPVDSGANKSSVVIGGSDDALPMSVFGRDMRERKEAESTTMKTEFVKTYSYDELGEKLRKLRPETGGESGFSLKELNERLMKLREMEEEKTKSRTVGVAFQDLKDSLVKLSMAGDEKANRSSIQRLDILGHLGGTPSFMLAPPKEHLVEQYFHPDNMSSAEKLKIELKNVRDEFKMSESDCGSARVQVAQLTTKIKHLNSALHKKDKHSRKGLQAMVQRRKKLLKYLRRTDWDSYCLVLSKLGLRDNPDYKN